MICLCHHYADSRGSYNHPSIWFLLFRFNGFPGMSRLYNIHYGWWGFEKILSLAEKMCIDVWRGGFIAEYGAPFSMFRLLVFITMKGFLKLCQWRNGMWSSNQLPNFQSDNYQDCQRLARRGRGRSLVASQSSQTEESLQVKGTKHARDNA